MKIVIFTAHPDDEFIFAYNFITNKKLTSSITVICSTYTDDSMRGKEFISSCAAMGVKGILLGCKDDMYEPLTFKLSENVNSIIKSSNLIVTHNPFGEYGHRHHKDCFNYINTNFSNDKWVFSQNYKLPDCRYTDVEKLNSPIIKIYEREHFILFNFNLIEEGFCEIK